MNRSTNRSIRWLGLAALFLGLAATSARAAIPTTDMALWLKADAITGISDGGAVNTWVDSSPSPYTVTGTGGPTYSAAGFNGHPAVQFDGTSQSFAVPGFSATADMTVFVVGQFQPSSPYGLLFFMEQTADAATAGEGFYISGANYYGALMTRNGNADAIQVIFGPGPAGTPFMSALSAFQFSTTANSWSNWEDGSALLVTDATSPSGNPTGTVTDQLNIMSRDQGSSGLWSKGNLAELLIYNSALNTSDRQLVEGSLAWKYGLQGSLPNDHPWAFQNPDAVPEPATVLLLLAGGGLLFKARRGRR